MVEVYEHKANGKSYDPAFLNRYQMCPGSFGVSLPSLAACDKVNNALVSSEGA
jgi:hypothetical protein